MRILFVFLFFLSFWSPAFAQEQSSNSSQEEVSSVVSFDDWNALAETVETEIQDRRTTDERLQELRAGVVDWRARLTRAQEAGGARLQTVRTQMDALGPTPEDGVEEVPEIAQRREELRKQIAELEAPALAAEEALTRANGLIGEIDIVVRERQAEALLELYPTPTNPAIWPDAAAVVWGEVSTLVNETKKGWGNVQPPYAWRANLPLIVGLTFFALLTLSRTQRWITRLQDKIENAFQTRRGRNASAICLSTLRVILPVAGLYALVTALRLTGFVGPSSRELLVLLPIMGTYMFSGLWLAASTFPERDLVFNPLQLNDGSRREGRLLTVVLGIVVGLEYVRQSWLVPRITTDEVLSVVSAPLLLISALALWRLGTLLQKTGESEIDSEGEEETENEEVSEEEDEDGQAPQIFTRLMRLMGFGTRLLAVLAVALTLIGYIPGALALTFPLILSLALVFVLLVLILLETDLYDVVTRRPPDAGPSLFTSLVALGLVFVSVPAFALIWGVRVEELVEIWVLFRDGFSLGETRIRPTNFIWFLVIFFVGFFLTKALQGVVSSSVLPKTKMDRGSQKALLSGLRYVGVFLSAVLAFSLAGIDLSSLAIVLGALSVGIGFGLQNIVSNFISGIILLIERPISEGDWIEVGGVMGTVRSVSVRSTTIETFDRTAVIVPNADLVSGSVTNWTRYNKTGRLILKVGVAYGTDTRKVVALLEEVGNSVGDVSKFPTRPQGLFRGFGESALNFELRVILRDVNTMMSTETEINHKIAEVFAREKIEVPFVQRDLWIRNPEALHPRGPVDIQKG